MLTDQPKVGVGVCIIKDNKVLLGRRKGAHGSGCWSFPGGHLEFNESVEDCAKREVLEETGIQIQNLKRGPYTNDIFEKEGKHYVTMYIISEYASGELKVMEPDKCEKWEWFELNKLPFPLFVPIQHLVEQKYTPF
ncbi:MAG: NUDIX hydrolase [Nanoarchaeota archaeon]